MQKQRMTKTITGTYTVTLADCGYKIICNSATPFTITLPSATGKYNFSATIQNKGAGAVTCDSKIINQNCALILSNDGGSTWHSTLIDSYGGTAVKADLLSADTNITITGGTDKIFDSDATITLSRNPTLTSVQFDISATPPAHEEGLVHWNDDEKCLEFGEPNGGSLQIGQEERLRAKNNEATTIYNGQVVYICGAVGTNICVELADADSYGEAVRAIAVATEDVAPNTSGRFTTFGFVRTLDTSAYTEGSLLYLSATPGMMSATPPAYPANRVAIGVVTRSHATEGEIGVKITYVPRKFGDIDNGNYSGFEDDGTLVFNGNATVYNDIIMPASNLRPGASPPTFSVFKGGIYGLAFSPTILEEVHGAAEMQHNYKEGTDIEVHVHWSPATTNVGDCLWKFEYTKANMATGVFGTTTTLIPTTGITTTGTAYQHQYTSIGVISGTGMKIGDIIVYRVYRDATSGSDTYTGGAFLHSVGIHYECDTSGSRNITGK